MLPIPQNPKPKTQKQNTPKQSLGISSLSGQVENLSYVQSTNFPLSAKLESTMNRAPASDRLLTAVTVMLAAVTIHWLARPAEGQPAGPYVTVLGIAQDAGYPQAGCRKDCCKAAWSDATKRRHVVSLAIVDPASNKRWLLDCSPDFRDQMQNLEKLVPSAGPIELDGIFLTHAHIGHYTGLMHLGREVIGSRNIPVYAMPRMKAFLEENGPWSQLVTTRNITIRELADEKATKLLGEKLDGKLTVTPFLVPHRDEYSETVGFRIEGPNRTAIYLPDIDKWERWEKNIEEVIRSADVAYLDGTFYDNGELPNRDMSLIPHPFVVESMLRFRRLPKSERNKIHFIHLNHTNPLLDPKSPASAMVNEGGFHVAKEGDQFGL